MTPHRNFFTPAWSVDKLALHTEDLASFYSLSTLLSSPMQPVTLDRHSGVSRLCLRANYYVKTFNTGGSRLKYALGISRYQREVRNLKYFATLGLMTPGLVACGHQSRFGLPEKAVMVTAEVRDAYDLEQILHGDTFYSEGVKAARDILRQLALAAQLMHSRGFYHKDLKTRNVLVRRTGETPELFFFDCPSGHRPPRLLLRRGIVRDLAHLEEGLRGHVRRVDLLYMYKQYRGCVRLNDADKALARDALNYYSQRRMTRKRRLREARRNA